MADKVKDLENENKVLQERITDLDVLIVEKDSLISELEEKIEQSAEDLKVALSAKVDAEKSAKIVPSAAYKFEEESYRFLNKNASFIVPRLGAFTTEKALKNDEVMRALILSESGMIEKIVKTKKKK